MDESEQSGGKHASKHARTGVRIDAGMAEFQFSARIVKRFASLEAAIRSISGDPHFSGETLKNLHHWASGKKGTVDLALYDLATIVGETLNHVHETGNRKAEEALQSLTSELAEGMQLTTAQAPVGAIVGFRGIDAPEFPQRGAR